MRLIRNEYFNIISVSRMTGENFHNVILELCDVFWMMIKLVHGCGLKLWLHNITIRKDYSVSKFIENIMYQKWNGITLQWNVNIRYSRMLLSNLVANQTIFSFPPLAIYDILLRRSCWFIISLVPFAMNKEDFSSISNELIKCKVKMLSHALFSTMSFNHYLSQNI